MRAYGATTVGVVANVGRGNPNGRAILGFISYGCRGCTAAPQPHSRSTSFSFIRIAITTTHAAVGRPVKSPGLAAAARSSAFLRSRQFRCWCAGCWSSKTPTTIAFTSAGRCLANGSQLESQLASLAHPRVGGGWIIFDSNLEVPNTLAANITLTCAGRSAKAASRQLSCGEGPQPWQRHRQRQAGAVRRPAF